MLKYESKPVLLKENCETVYNFISDLTNFNRLIKDYEINDWKADSNYCEFRVNNFGKIALKISESQPYEYIKYTTTEESFINFNIRISLNNTPEKRAESKLYLEADVPFFLQPLVKNHLQKIIDIITKAMENFNFKSQ